MKENQILIAIKEPGKPARLEPLFDNKLEAFQDAVDGYIETLTVFSDVTFVLNEEGRLRGLPHNINILGVPLFGTVLAVGVKRDNFCSLKASCIPTVLKMLNEENGDADC